MDTKGSTDTVTNITARNTTTAIITTAISHANRNLLPAIHEEGAEGVIEAVNDGPAGISLWDDHQGMPTEPIVRSAGGSTARWSWGLGEHSIADARWASPSRICRACR